MTRSTVLYKMWRCVCIYGVIMLNYDHKDRIVYDNTEPHEAVPEVSKGKVHITQDKHVPIEIDCDFLNTFHSISHTTLSWCWLERRSTKNYSVLLRTTQYYSSTILYYSCTTLYYKVLQSTIQYYKVLLQYCSVLQSTTPVLVCTTKYYSSTTLYYKVLLCTTKYYSVLLCTTKYYSNTTLYYKVLLQYYSHDWSASPMKL